MRSAGGDLSIPDGDACHSVYFFPEFLFIHAIPPWHHPGSHWFRYGCKVEKAAEGLVTNSGQGRAEIQTQPNQKFFHLTM
jgi:hypothetical protein